MFEILCVVLGVRCLAFGVWCFLWSFIVQCLRVSFAAWFVVWCSLLIFVVFFIWSLLFVGLRLFLLLFGVRWLLFVGCCLLVVGCWLLFAGFGVRCLVLGAWCLVLVARCQAVFSLRFGLLFVGCYWLLFIFRRLLFVVRLCVAWHVVVNACCLLVVCWCLAFGRCRF